MIEKLYSDFDPDLTITTSEGKTFDEKTFPFKQLENVDEIATYSKAVREIVVIKHEQKMMQATLTGVDQQFFKIAKINDHIVDGTPKLQEGEENFGVIGATLLDQLGGFIPKRIGHETIQLYAPKRDAKMKLGSNPFRIEQLKISARMNYNREVNIEQLLVPIDFAQNILNYDNDLSCIFIDVKSGISNELAKEKIQLLVGNKFLVKTNYEKNELIYKTSKSEKLIVIIILIFIFILAAFNLIASLTMLFVEKKNNIKTMHAMGFPNKGVFKIFFFEGLLISFSGVFIGLVLGYLVCLLQLQFGLLQMPNSGGEAFPIALSVKDGMLIIFLVSALNILFSYFTVKILMKRFNEEQFQTQN